MNKKKIVKAKSYLYCSKCEKMIFPEQEMMVEETEEGVIQHQYCLECGKGYPIGTLIN